MSALDEIEDIQFCDNNAKEASEAKREVLRIVATLRDDKLKLEIAARDFLRATDMHSLLTQAEFNEARDTLAAMVNKGDE